MLAGEVLARDGQAAVSGGTDGVDDRVVVLGELLRGDVVAHFETEMHTHPVMRVEPGEGLADLLGGRVVRRHAVAHEAADHRQPVDEGHLGVGVQQQILHGVHPGRSGADDGDPERREVGRQDTRERRAAPGVEVGAVLDRVRTRIGVPVPVVEVRGVDRGVLLLRRGQRVHREDRVDRAGVGARAAVDAGHRVDVQHLRAAERPLLGGGVDAVDRAHGDTRRVAAAGLGDGVRHVVNSRRLR